MRFTAGDLRGSIVQPASVVERLRAALGPTRQADTPRSPQRAWIEASLRRYYAAHRNPDVLIRDYRARTAGKGATARKRSEIANGESMLQLFLTWEEPEPNARISMLKRTDQPVAGHTISLAHELVYERPDGYMVRDIWTDGIAVRPEHRRLVSAAALVHADQLLGVGRVHELQVWQLRLGLQEQISRSDAYALMPNVRRVLNQIEHELAT